MVKVQFGLGSLKVTGHADDGEDTTLEDKLICNSVSVLVQALEIGISNRFLKVMKKEPGDLEYLFLTPADPAKSLYVISCVKMIQDALKILADENPEQCEVILNESN